MAKVFSNDMTVHVWAQQTQAEGGNSARSLFFEGPTLFSYGRHYAAGHVLHMPDGRRVGLWNTKSRSITTSRHVSRARGAMGYSAFPCDNLTDWAATLLSAVSSFSWVEAEKQEEDGTRADWLPLGRVLKSMKERRESLKPIKARLAEKWPGEDAARAIMESLGEKNAREVAATMAAKKARKVEKEKAQKAKENRDAIARNAKATAAMTSRELRARISDILGSYRHSDYARDKLARWGRELNAEAKEAKARGWTRVAAACRVHHKAIRAAVADHETKAAAAYRNKNRRNAIARFREAAAIVAAGQFASRSAEDKARWQGELAAAAAGVSRHVESIGDATRARLAAIQEEARAREAEEQERAQRARHKEQEEARAAWLAGGTSGRAYGLRDARGGPLLRAVAVERDDSGDITAGELQTSQGAAVPLVHALRAFRFLKRCRAIGQDWQSNGKKLRVGHFTIDSVQPSGDFVAGCHRINWGEVERLAAALGVADLAPADTTEGA